MFILEWQNCKKLEPCEITTLLQLVRSSCQVLRREDKADAFEAEADD